MLSPSPIAPHPRRRGIALITTLILLAIMTVLAVVAARIAALEERMAGNMRDRDIALRAAEMGLRDAEWDVMTARGIAGCTGFVPGCANGLCYNGWAGYTVPVWTAIDMTVSPSVGYGQYTNATRIAGVFAQPRYLIECIGKQVPGGGGLTYYYQVTVRAVGRNPNTVVRLQEVFTPHY